MTSRTGAAIHDIIRTVQRRLPTPILIADAAVQGQTAPNQIVMGMAMVVRAGVDVVIVASAPADLQRQRVLARPGMTPERLARLLDRQMADADKRRAADFVVDTGGTFADTHAQVDRILESLEGRQGSAYGRFWA